MDSTVEVTAIWLLDGLFQLSACLPLTFHHYFPLGLGDNKSKYFSTAGRGEARQLGAWTPSTTA